MVVNADDLAECVTHLLTVFALTLVGILAILARSSTNQTCVGGKHVKEHVRPRRNTAQGTRPDTKRCAITVRFVVGSQRPIR